MTFYFLIHEIMDLVLCWEIQLLEAMMPIGDFQSTAGVILLPCTVTGASVLTCILLKLTPFSKLRSVNEG